MITQSLKKINKLKKPYKIIQGSSSAGKTWAILILLIDKAAKSRVIIDVVSMTYDHLRDGAIQDFKDIMQDTGRWFEKRWNKSEHIYRFGNGSMIRFKSMDKPGKAKGPRRDILYVNEANYMSEEIFTQLSVRTKGEVFIDYNPTNRFWAHDYVDRDDTDFIKLTYRDNEFVEEKILNDYAHNREKAKTSDYWANWCRVYLDGEIGILEGVVFQNWKEIDRVPDEATLLGYGMDFGFSADPTTFIGLYKYDGQLVLDELLYQTGLTNNDIARIVKQEGITQEIYCDSAEPKSIREISNYGIRAYPTKKGKDSIVYGIDLLQGFDLLVTRRSNHLKEELNAYSWKKDRDGNTLNIPIDAWNHCIDALRYISVMKLGKNTEFYNPVSPVERPVKRPKWSR